MVMVQANSTCEYPGPRNTNTQPARTQTRSRAYFDRHQQPPRIKPTTPQHCFTSPGLLTPAHPCTRAPTPPRPHAHALMPRAPTPSRPMPSCPTPSCPTPSCPRPHALIPTPSCPRYPPALTQHQRRGLLCREGGDGAEVAHRDAVAPVRAPLVQPVTRLRPGAGRAAGLRGGQCRDGRRAACGTCARACVCLWEVWGGMKGAHCHG